MRLLESEFLKNPSSELQLYSDLELKSPLLDSYMNNVRLYSSTDILNLVSSYRRSAKLPDAFLRLEASLIMQYTGFYCINNKYSKENELQQYILRTDSSQKTIDILFDLSLVSCENKETLFSRTLCNLVRTNNHVGVDRLFSKYERFYNKVGLNSLQGQIVVISKDACFLACRLGRLESLKCLHKNAKGINFNEANEEGETQFWLACRSGDLSTVKYLYEKVKGIDFTRPTNKGQTEFYAACLSGDLPTVKYVHKNIQGIDFTQPNNYGQTPFYAACLSGNLPTVKYLYQEVEGSIDGKGILIAGCLLIAFCLLISVCILGVKIWLSQRT